MIQDILIYILVFVAVLILIRRFIPKGGKHKKDCDSDCNCS
ncbi:MAG: FeoB-associated Cys-rich membrane protein [Flavobacteriaceae bacterium]|nr:MAG: FeoB-associated Cys-rich membrane protein [Flavobacteriaceae bacterium]